MSKPTAGTSSPAVASSGSGGDIMEQVIVKGDLKALSPQERAMYYARVCESMGLNPLTQPFQYIMLNQRLTLYATRTATDQLRKINGVSVTGIEKQLLQNGIYTVTVKVMDREGREDEEIGAVSVEGLKGEALSNAMMKAVTKAKRRATLSICGLGWLDETEVESIRGVTIIPDDDPLVALPTESEGEERTRLMARLHAMAAEGGMDHEALRAWVQGYYPEATSFTKLDTADLRYLVAVWLEADPTTGEILDENEMGDDLGSQILNEYRDRILGANSQEELRGIAAEIRDGGITDAGLRAVYAARLAALDETPIQVAV